MAVRRAVTGKQGQAYRGCKGRKERSHILDELVALTGYNRHYAAWLLRNYGRTRLLAGRDGTTIRLVVGQYNRRGTTGRERCYDESVKRPLVYLWNAFDQMCGKRLAAILPGMLPTLVKHRLLSRTDPAYQKLAKISGSTIDRLLRPERASRRLKGISHTKPSTMLKNSIPVVLSSELHVDEPGHFQIDLVGHDGGDPNGQFAFTLTALDLYSGWVEPRPLRNKAHRWAKEALQSVHRDCPLAIKSLHSDNDSAFLNEPIQAWAAAQSICYRRGRPYHSNDTCWVEQKNNAIVRSSVGYARYETEQELALLEALYQKLRLLVNFFYPSVKLIDKRRVEGRIRKRYDRPKTPASRLLDSAALSPAIKHRLRAQLRSLDAIQLSKQISRIQRQLLALVRRKGMKIMYPGPAYPQAKERMEAQLFPQR
jgi:transposase InsO family protein